MRELAAIFLHAEIRSKNYSFIMFYLFELMNVQTTVKYVRYRLLGKLKSRYKHLLKRRRNDLLAGDWRDLWSVVACKNRLLTWSTAESPRKLIKRQDIASQKAKRSTNKAGFVVRFCSVHYFFQYCAMSNVAWLNQWMAAIEALKITLLSNKNNSNEVIHMLLTLMFK